MIFKLFFSLLNQFDAQEKICANAPIFVVPTDEDGSLLGTPVLGTATATGTKVTVADPFTGSCFVDFYVTKESAQVSELQIDAENFAGYYYVEASTLFRRQHDGVDLPAEITFPNVKIQSNFTFSMASSGDPSTFTFTMDALPGYTHFNPTKKVLCAIQIVEDGAVKAAGAAKSVFSCDEDGHAAAEDLLGN